VIYRLSTYISLCIYITLRVECLMQTDSEYPKDGETQSEFIYLFMYIYHLPYVPFLFVR